MFKYIFTIISLLQGMVLPAQTAVRNEPRHHNVFENDYVRVLDVYIPPNDTTQFHLHNTPSVFITFTRTQTGSEIKGQQPERSSSTAGFTWFDSLNTPRLHRVWNEDNTWFHVMDIELTGSESGNNEQLLNNPSLQLLYNESLVNVYKLEIKDILEIKLPPSKKGYLLISLGDVLIEMERDSIPQHRKMKAGHYIWMEAGKSLAIIYCKTIHAKFTLLQLK